MTAWPRYRSDNSIVLAWLALSIAASDGAGIVILLSLWLSLRDEVQELRQLLRALEQMRGG